MTPTANQSMFSANGILSSGFPNANYALQLSQTVFDPDTPTGFLECNFAGYAAINFTQWGNGIDVQTNTKRIVGIAPAGGFRFVACTTLPSAQGIYGYRVLDRDRNSFVGYAAITPPLSVAIPGQQFNCPTPAFTLADAFLS